MHMLHAHVTCSARSPSQKSNKLESKIAAHARFYTLVRKSCVLSPPPLPGEAIPQHRMKHLRVAVFVTLVVTALLVLQGTRIAPALFSTTQQQRGVEVELRRQLQVANRELAGVQERLELASVQGRRLQERLDSQKTPPAALAQAATAAVEPPQPATAEAQRWDDTPDHRRLYELLHRVANPRREVMVGLVNDVMMCTNRKTCWWNGGNVLEMWRGVAGFPGRE